MIKWIKLIKNIKNLKIKYKLHSSFNNYYKSNLIDLTGEPIKYVDNLNIYSYLLNYYIKYGEVNNNFKKYIILIMIYHIIYIIINL